MGVTTQEIKHNNEDCHAFFLILFLLQKSSTFNPNGYNAGQPGYANVPVITHDQRQHLCIANWSVVRNGGVSPFGDTITCPLTGNYAPWNRDNDTQGNTQHTAAITNDSSSPYCVVVGQQAALLGCFFGSGGAGPDPSANVVALQSAIGNSYALTILPMGGVPLIVGPAGPAGSDGAAGPAGPTGPAGPASSDGSFNVYTVYANSDKLAQTGLNPGDYTILQGEGNRVEQYIPASISSNPDLIVSGTSILDGNYTYDPNTGDYNGVGVSGYYPPSDFAYGLPAITPGGSAVVDGSTHTWVLHAFDNVIASYGDGGTTPDQAVWSATQEDQGDGPNAYSAANVSAVNPISDEANWKLIGNNTINLTFVEDGGTGSTVNGITVTGDATPTYIGWVDPTQPIPIVCNDGYISLIFAYLTDGTQQTLFPFGGISIGSPNFVISGASYPKGSNITIYCQD